ncbi:MAG TPA: ATP-binding protein [Noviherbaspirillum sp.]|uniref:ATP-binding protein n=1 Tax=Noviherbaspirillum sp. TaxID=1926288 RepID=UPI002D5730CC|nr:ATP-binding protein [Noviherbaspirillum sp.]HYD95786.1 ATP-binding protein [Noviherbaspirillum sp.]
MRAVFQSMTGRVILLIVAGVVASAALALYLASQERQRMIMQFREFHAVERLEQFVLSLENAVPSLSEPLVSAGRAGMRAQTAGADDLPALPRSTLAERLEQRLPDGYRVASAAPRPGDCEFGHMQRRRPHAEARQRCEVLLVTLRDGARLRVDVQPPRPFGPRAEFAPRTDFVAYALLFLASIGILAAAVARMTMRPLKELAKAATELGNDIERPPLPERGATELRQAAAAFNAMQARIRNHIRQRSHILAAITHDLQTPLTRLRLRLEKVEDAELRDKLIGDLSAMQGMVREGLDLARSMDAAGPKQRLDLDSLVDSVCADAADAGQEVMSEGRTHAALMAHPTALRRCLTNLIDNACKYGSYARISVGREGAQAMIHVRDGGPGIPESEMKNVFEPFFRLEGSRSRDTGGTGLGLTIARNIVEQHGGSISLRNLPAGGLEVTLALPCASA